MTPKPSQPASVISCKQLYDFLGEYVDGTLAAPQRDEFERHIRVCPSCQAYLDGYRRTIALGRVAYDAPDAAQPAAAPRGILDAVRAAVAKPR